MKQALLFAAGLGQRLQPHTLSTPKPLLAVAGKPLIVWHLEKLAAAGYQEVFINTSHLADQFEPMLGDGARWGLRLHYVYEGPVPLETGGGMRNILDRLGRHPFLAIAADIWSDIDYGALQLPAGALAHLVMVNNPSWHPDGDFELRDGWIHWPSNAARLTFSSIGVYRREFIASHAEGRFKLLPLYQATAESGQLSGELHQGCWHNIGTASQWQQLDQALSQAKA